MPWPAGAPADCAAPNLRDCCTPGTETGKRRERGDFEAPNLRDCCTPGTKAAKRCERGDVEGPNLRYCCTKKARNNSSGSAGSVSRAVTPTP